MTHDPDHWKWSSHTGGRTMQSTDRTTWPYDPWYAGLFFVESFSYTFPTSFLWCSGKSSDFGSFTFILNVIFYNSSVHTDVNFELCSHVLLCRLFPYDSPRLLLMTCIRWYVIYLFIIIKKPIVLTWDGSYDHVTSFSHHVTGGIFIGCICIWSHCNFWVSANDQECEVFTFQWLSGVQELYCSWGQSS